MEILYVYQWEEDVWGPGRVPPTVDIEASCRAFAAAVKAALEAEYPGARVIVRPGPHHMVVVDHDRKHREIPWIQAAVLDVWETLEWVQEVNDGAPETHIGVKE